MNVVSLATKTNLGRTNARAALTNVSQVNIYVLPVPQLRIGYATTVPKDSNVLMDQDRSLVLQILTQMKLDKRLARHALIAPSRLPIRPRNVPRLQIENAQCVKEVTVVTMASEKNALHPCT